MNGLFKDRYPNKPHLSLLVIPFSSKFIEKMTGPPRSDDRVAGIPLFNVQKCPGAQKKKHGHAGSAVDDTNEDLM